MILMTFTCTQTTLLLLLVNLIGCQDPISCKENVEFWLHKWQNDSSAMPKMIGFETKDTGGKKFAEWIWLWIIDDKTETTAVSISAYSRVVFTGTIATWESEEELWGMLYLNMILHIKQKSIRLETA